VFEPWWPLAALATIQAVDAVFCWKPVGFVRTCLTNVRFPERWWPVLTPMKAAAAAGLLIGIWLPWLAALTSGALVAYFLIAIGAHINASDIGRDLLLNATGMLVLSAGTFAFVLQAW
jgi:hypothetical protein